VCSLSVFFSFTGSRKKPARPLSLRLQVIDLDLKNFIKERNAKHI